MSKCPNVHLSIFYCGGHLACACEEIILKKQISSYSPVLNLQTFDMLTIVCTKDKLCNNDFGDVAFLGLSH